MKLMLKKDDSDHSYAAISLMYGEYDGRDLGMIKCFQGLGLGFLSDKCGGGLTQLWTVTGSNHEEEGIWIYTVTEGVGNLGAGKMKRVDATEMKPRS